MLYCTYIDVEISQQGPLQIEHLISHPHNRLNFTRFHEDVNLIDNLLEGLMVYQDF